MDVQSTQESVTKLAVDAVVIGVYADESPSGAAVEVDKALDGLLSKLIESKEICTNLGQVTPLLVVPGVAAGQVVCVGLGSREDLEASQAFRAAGAASRYLAGKERASVAMFIDDRWVPSWVEAGIAGALAGCVAQDLYRVKKKRHPIGELFWAGASEEVIRTGVALGEGVNLTRRLVNEPPDVIYPETFAAKAREVANEFGMDIEVWDRKKLTEERCGALLAVSQGSVREPQMVQMHYRGGGDSPVMALVGKGVTFDSGGLSLKTSEGMKIMKCDMAGAATVLGAIQAIAAMKLPVNVSGYMGLVENMTGAAAYRLGDVLTARNGITIEVHNTDAEGRLVLADTLTVAAEAKPSRIIDLATLTGACVVALGENITGLMTNDEDWGEAIIEASEATGEPVWPLPMFDEFKDQIQSKIADIKNTGDGRWGGAMTAAALLEHFVDELPWTHLDIAGPAFAEKPLDWLDGGGTGVMVRTLVEIARSSDSWEDED